MASMESGVSAASPLLEGFEGFRSTSLADIVWELAHREEIRELIARYAHLVARKQSAAALFTEDGGFVFRTPDGNVKEARGRHALEAIFDEIVRPPNHSLPTVHNQLISIAGDTATGLCWIELRADKDGEQWIGSGYYEDVFRRENDRWKFVIRDSTLVKWERAR